MVWAFKEKSVAETLKDAVKRSEPKHTNDPLQIPSTTSVTKIVYVAKSPAGGIDAAAEDGNGDLTPGTATCDIYKYNIDTGKYEKKMVDASTIMTKVVDNISQTAVVANKFLQLKRESSGRWLADWEDCTAE